MFLSTWWMTAGRFGLGNFAPNFKLGNFQVIYRVLPPNINIHSPGFNPYSKEVQDLLKTTNLRITFNRLLKLGDEKLDSGINPVDIKEK